MNNNEKQKMISLFIGTPPEDVLENEKEFDKHIEKILKENNDK